MTISARWKSGAIRRVSAEVAAHEIERLRQSTPSGVLRPSDLVEASRDKDSPLHEQFTWDDSVAGEKWRVQEARLTIDRIEIVDSETKIQNPAFVNVTLSTGERGYMSTSVAMADDELRKQTLQNALNGLAAWRRRYEGLSELAGVVSVIDAVLSEVAWTEVPDRKVVNVDYTTSDSAAPA